MPAIPECVAYSDQYRYLLRCGFGRPYQGKVRDVYDLASAHMDGSLLFSASDRLSIFDWVLPGLVPRKGEVLTGLVHFWLTKELADFPNHLYQKQESGRASSQNMVRVLALAYRGIDVRRSLVVKKCEIPPYEMIYRGHLGGSVWKDYLKTQKVAGQPLPEGLLKWTRMHPPLFTPSTKSASGHDENITYQRYLEETGDVGELNATFFRKVYERAYKYAAQRGIILLDSKFEGKFCIADEALTPDSSRYTTEKSLINSLAMHEEPVFYDKQYVRQWGMEVETPWGVGINNLKDTEDKKAIEWVANTLKVPEDVLLATTEIYLKIFEMLVGCPLDEYQRDEMGIDLAATVA